MANRPLWLKIYCRLCFPTRGTSLQTSIIRQKPVLHFREFYGQNLVHIHKSVIVHNSKVIRHMHYGFSPSELNRNVIFKRIHQILDKILEFQAKHVFMHDKWYHGYMHKMATISVFAWKCFIFFQLWNSLDWSLDASDDDNQCIYMEVFYFFPMMKFIRLVLHLTEVAMEDCVIHRGKSWLILVEWIQGRFACCSYIVRPFRW